MIDIVHTAAAAFALVSGMPQDGATTPATQEPQAEPAVATQAQPAQLSLNSFNPQISVVTDFRWNAIDDDPTADKRAYLKEAELGLAADVDPFLRAEAYIAFADEDGETVAEVEEAFGTYSKLGKGLSAKFGKIAAAIGRVQRNHADQQNWLDFPFVVQDMLGEEGLRAGGASLSYLLPGEQFHEFTLEGFDAPDGNLFSGAHGGSPLWVGHYRTFFDFSEDASAQLGATYANGPSFGSSSRSNLYGVDLTYKWLPGTPGKSLVAEAEAYWGRPGGSGDTAFGGFAALTYQVRPRWFATAKVDYSEIPGTTDIRRAWSLGATLKVTEFHHWRAEFQSIASNFAPTRNVLNLQFQWLIGAHPAHKY